MPEPIMILLMGAAGGLGATLRFAVDQALRRLLGESFGWGTMLVNLTGSFALGLVSNLALGLPAGLVLGVGLLGGYTTFSTASWETVQLLRERRYGAALLAGPGMLLGCSALAVAGFLVGS